MKMIDKLVDKTVRKATDEVKSQFDKAFPLIVGGILAIGMLLDRPPESRNIINVYNETHVHIHNLHI